MKALRINVATQSVEPIEIDNWESIAPAIGNGCTLFCVPLEFENSDALYADDESLLRDGIEGMFAFKDNPFIIVGNAIVLGSNKKGESTDVKYTAEEVRELIMFGDKQSAENYQKGIMNGSPIIYSGF